MARITALLFLVLLARGANAAPVTFYAGKAEPFIAEGIARDANTDRVFVASVARRRIVMIEKGRARDFVRLPDDFSPFGIAFSGGRLWVTAAVVTQGAGHDGPSALLSFDPSGHLAGRYPVMEEGRHVVGDLTFAPDGTVYVSDGLGGSLYALSPGAHALTRLGTGRLFKSPQGMSVSGDGKSLLVADYSTGLWRLDLATAALTALTVPEGVNVKGIDGLARLSDGSFLASQNGTKEPHILRLTLSADWSQILARDVVAENDPLVADPSLVMADASGAYVVGVSQWSSFGETQTPTKPLYPWRIVKLAQPPNVLPK